MLRAPSGLCFRHLLQPDHLHELLGMQQIKVQRFLPKSAVVLDSCVNPPLELVIESIILQLVLEHLGTLELVLLNDVFEIDEVLKEI